MSDSTRLVHADGSSIPLRAGGVLLGRSADCDVITADPKASTVHVLVRPAPGGAEVVPVGRNPTWVDDTRIERRTPLLDGQWVRIPGLDLQLRVATGAVRRSAWRLATPGTTFGLRRWPVRLGSDADDDVGLASWPRTAVVLHLAQGRVVAEAMVAGVRIGSRALDVGEFETLASGDAMQVADVAVRLLDDPDAEPETVADAGDDLPDAADLELLPSGGWLTLHWARGGTARVPLSEQRLALLATLLSPPRGYVAGDYVPDSVVASAIWPGRDDRGRTDVNLVLHRARKDLLAAGINGKQVLDRSPVGGATRFALAPRARATVR